MSDLWTEREAAQASGGRLLGGDDWRAGGVSIDTRTLEPGDLFVALKDVRDGHDFLAQAFVSGASAALVSDVSKAEGLGPVLVVADVLDGLRRLGEAARERSGAKRIGVTGSVGKTSTKEALALCLAASGPTHRSVKSYNNHWGVPLTLARMPRESAFGVFEMGMNNRGEILPLTQLVRPHAAIVTAVAPAHIEDLGSMEAIADEKGHIYAGLEPGGADLPVRPGLVPAAWQSKIDEWVLLNTAAGESEFLVYLAEQADLSGAATLPTRLEKGRYVYHQLTETAQRTQPALLQVLLAQGVAYQPFWVANMVLVRGDLAVLAAVAQRSDVAHVYANPAVKADLGAQEPVYAGAAPSAIVPNLLRVKADQVWAAGFTGQGVVIGGQDTGYDWDHPALKQQYRGWNGSSANHNPLRARFGGPLCSLTPRILASGPASAKPGPVRQPQRFQVE